MTEDYLTYGHRIAQYVADTAKLTWDVLDSRANVLFEGAQGTLLDIDHGTYPFVTSSNPVSASACTGTGVGPKDIDEVWGIAKAYATRVGSGPFPTELDDELGSTLREAGGEYGTTTGRARRVGWVDLVALRYATRINSLTHLAVTKLDVLTGLGDLNVCVRYRGAEEATFDHYPYHQTVMHQASGDYERLPGWDEDITECREERELPQNARDYLQYISDFINVPIALIGVGPGRDQVIWTEAGREQPRGADRRRRLAADHARAREEVVQRTVLLVPQRPQDVDERQDARASAAAEAVEQPPLEDRLAQERALEVHRRAVDARDADAERHPPERAAVRARRHHDGVDDGRDERARPQPHQHGQEDADEPADIVVQARRSGPRSAPRAATARARR